MRCKREKILPPSNSRKNVDFDLLIEQQNRIFWDDLIYLKRLAKGDAEAWKMLNDQERRAIYTERNKTKLRFVKKFIWIRDKQRGHIVGLRQDLAKNANEKKRRKMLEIPNASERGEELVKCKLCWQKRKKWF